MREFPSKGRKHLDWITLITLKCDVQAQTWSGVSQTVRKPNERLDGYST